MGSSLDEKQNDDNEVAPEQVVEETRSMEKNDEHHHAVTPTPEGAKSDYEYLVGTKLYAVLASLTLVFFLVMLDMSIVSTAIPRITSHFHSLHDVGWYASAYLLSSCALQPLVGKLYTHLSSKITFLAFLALFELGSVLCGAAQSSAMLIIGRAVAGLGSSGLSNGALTIIAAAAPLHKRPAMLGAMMSISQLGIVGGPLIGGALTQSAASWRWCFYINLPIGAITSIILLLINIPDRIEKINDSKPTPRAILSKLDLTGFVLFAGFAVMVLLALEWGGTTYPWRSATIIGLFCGGGVALVVFTVWEYRLGDRAMIPPSIVRKREVWCSCLVISLLFGGMIILSYYLPIYFQAVKGVSPVTSGVYILPSILSQMLMAVTSGLLVGKLGYYIPWIVASAVIVTVASGLMSTFSPHTPTVEWVMYQFLAGFGRGCGLQMPLIAIQNSLSPEQNAVGMALAVFCQTFGGSLFSTIAQTLFSQGLSSGLEKYAPAVDAESVIAAGASAFRQVVNPDQLVGVLRAYSLAVSHTFYLAAGSTAVMFFFCWGMGWHKIAKKNVVKPEA